MGSVSQPLFAPERLTSRKWFRTWSDEHARYFYWDAATSQTTWDVPPMGDVIVDHATMQEVPRESASPVPVLASTNVLSAFTSQSSSSVLQQRADSSPKPLLKSKVAGVTLSSTTNHHQTSPDALKTALFSSAASHVPNTVSSQAHAKQPTISAEKLKEIEEADRKLAEKLQEEMDKEFEETRANMPSPAEALAMMRQKKANKSAKTVAGEGSQNNDELVKDMAQQGFTVKVSKNKRK